MSFNKAGEYQFAPKINRLNVPEQLLVHVIGQQILAMLQDIFVGESETRLN